ncbi:MAG: GSCFA domain-containing protein [Maribacter sp.]|nr:GSCFA domain-containing protein [Maribacter sp.]
MKLQTLVPLQQASNQIDYQSRVLLLGSCFVENIGKKLDYFKFRTLRNPFGILFHPKAIENLVLRSIQKISYTGDDVFYHNERWHCFDAHSDLSDASKEDLLEKLNHSLEQTNQQIARTTHIIITLGTAWVYRHLETNAVVANCHKIPQKEFSKELLSVDAIVACLENMIGSIQSVNPNAHLIFTVSPVRHLKDGFIENQQSKAHLISAMHQIIDKKVSFSRVEGYFPSYEIMMDELRDYRFYEADMVHPNQLAIDYIWDRFKSIWISNKDYPTMEKVEAIQKGIEHRPFNPDSVQHQKFLGSLQNKMKDLKKEYPFIDF